MAAFDLSDAHRHPFDFDLLANGPVHHQVSTAEQHRTTEQLQSLGYSLIKLDAANWSGAGDMHDAVSTAFGCPAYGRDLDALADCLGYVAEGRYGWQASSSTGLVVTVEGFDRYATAQPEQASFLLELAAQCGSYALLFGHRVVWLVVGSALR